MGMQFEIPITYKNTGTPPKCRRPQDYRVIDKAWFDFPVADPSELEPALTFRLRYRLKEDGELLNSDTVFHQYRGHLMRDVDVSRYGDGARLDIAALSSMAHRGHSWVPKILVVPSSRNISSYTGYEVGLLKDKHVDVSGRTAAVEELQAFITDNLVIVDGVVYAKNHDPAINVHIGNEGFSVDPSLVGRSNYSFPFNRMDLVDEFTSWLENECGIPRKKAQDTWDRDRGFILDALDVPLSANPIIEAGLHLAGRAQLNITNAAYWGEETKQLGLALQAEPTLANVFDFADAFEAAAMQPGAHKIEYGMENHVQLFSAFRKFVELMPDEYKQDFSETIDIPVSHAAQYSSPRS
jgi:hypothetical protein